MTLSEKFNEFSCKIVDVKALNDRVKQLAGKTMDDIPKAVVAAKTLAAALRGEKIDPEEMQIWFRHDAAEELRQKVLSAPSPEAGLAAMAPACADALKKGFFADVRPILMAADIVCPKKLLEAYIQAAREATDHAPQTLSGVLVPYKPTTRKIGSELADRFGRLA